MLTIINWFLGVHFLRLIEHIKNTILCVYLDGIKPAISGIGKKRLVSLRIKSYFLLLAQQLGLTEITSSAFGIIQQAQGYVRIAAFIKIWLLKGVYD